MFIRMSAIMLSVQWIIKWSIKVRTSKDSLDKELLIHLVKSLRKRRIFFLILESMVYWAILICVCLFLSSMFKDVFFIFLVIWIKRVIVEKIVSVFSSFVYKDVKPLELRGLTSSWVRFHFASAKWIFSVFEPRNRPIVFWRMNNMHFLHKVCI